ncbi:hypothetical protein Pyn_00553 [Prunus yedoensis var. nudiflora]|uniref:Uncharacterized protein n=1 Tax=Prunus yedoensis var. nudiflora TaxID=2094558 RepID=A0A314UM22_PRUYE|nr:hypothetical protein Pyn_00553 [Prunus yedoensis var. nudiflora]
MDPAGSSPDYSDLEPLTFSGNARGTTTVGDVQCEDIFEALDVAVAQNVGADLNFQDGNVEIAPNVQDGNVVIAPGNVQDENVEEGNVQDYNLNIAPDHLEDENMEEERLDYSAPTGTDASLDIDHGAPPSHASPGATVTEDSFEVHDFDVFFGHRNTSETLKVNIHDDDTRPLSELWEATMWDFKAKFKDSMANRKRPNDDAGGGDVAASSSKKKLKNGGDAAAGGSKKKLNVIGDVDVPRPARRSLAMRPQNANLAPHHPAGRRNDVQPERRNRSWGSRILNLREMRGRCERSERRELGWVEVDFDGDEAS